MGNSSSSSSRRSAYPGHRGNGGHHRSAAAASASVGASAGAAPATRTHTVIRGSSTRHSAGSGGGNAGGNRVISTTTYSIPPPGSSGSGGPQHSSSSGPAPSGQQQQQQPLTAQTISSPGAYSISRNDAGPTQVFRVQVPSGVGPNQEFQVYAGTRVVRVRCPPDVRPGQSLQITVPPDPVVRQNLLGMAPITSVSGQEGGGAVRMSTEVERVNRSVLQAEEASRAARQRQMERNNNNNNNNRRQSGMSSGAGSHGRRSPQPEDDDNSNSNDGQSSHTMIQPPPPTPAAPPQPQAYMVVVPPGVRPGSHFRVLAEGRELMVQCPITARPGMQVRIVPPVQPDATPPPASSQSTNTGTTGTNSAGTRGVTGITDGTSLDRPPDDTNRPAPAPRPKLTTQMFEVIVPPGVRPNQPFALLAGGQRVLVTCPPNAGPGQKIRFQLPVATPSTKSIESLKLNYDSIKDGWTRTIRVTDMKFQWVRMDEQGDVDLDSRFNVDRSAYVRRLLFLEGNDSRMRTGVLSLVPASEAAVDSKVTSKPDGTGREIVGYSDIVTAQGQDFHDKTRWFNDTCSRLTVDWNEGHMRINVRRQALLSDSVAAVMSLGRDDLRKIWRFEFMGEVGVDAGGLAREWFQLVTEQIFDPDNGLWLSGDGNQMNMRINPASEVSCPEDHLVYFRFLGRVMGKALFDQRLVSGHMTRHMYKHMLGWPVTFADLELVDEEYYQQLKKITEMDPSQVEFLCLDFTTQEDVLGVKKTVELIPDGANVEVTTDNLPEYLEACLKYRMLDRTKPQMTELLLGFFDVIPEPLLTVFDFQELELLMCGLPTIDVDDWMANTNYTGDYEQKRASHKVVRWFWDIVRDDFDHEMRARLLQFVTATSGVPSRGFSVLQGNDGNIKKFTIHGVDPKTYQYPRAHTCFNRIDLPTYGSKKLLAERLKLAVTTSATGFDIE